VTGKATTADIVAGIEKLRDDLQPLSELTAYVLREEMDWRDGQAYHNELRYRVRVGLEIRARKLLREVKGASLVVTDELCPASHPEGTPLHYLVCVCNGSGKSRPLCPIAVAIRRVRLDLRNGTQPEFDLVKKLLKHAEAKESTKDDADGSNGCGVS